MNSDLLVSSIIAAVPPTIMALASLLASIQNRKVVRQVEQNVMKKVGVVTRDVADVRNDIADVHEAVNGKAEELNNIVRNAAFAEGVKKGETQKIDSA